MKLKYKNIVLRLLQILFLKEGKYFLEIDQSINRFKNQKVIRIEKAQQTAKIHKKTRME